MSIANDILTDVLSKLSAQLGDTFSEHPDLFKLENASARHLTNGYSAILLDGDNSNYQSTGFTTIQRELVIKISYRTYTRPNGAKTKEVLSTLYTNEQALINYFLKYPSKPSGLLGMVDPVQTMIETIKGEDDDFLVNTITMNAVYRFSYN